MEKILVIGSGGHSSSVVDVINQTGKYEIQGLIGEAINIGKTIHGLEVVGSDNDLFAKKFDCQNLAMGIGQIHSPVKRIQLYSSLKKIGYQFPSIISPRAYVSEEVKIGEASIVFHGAMINFGCKIGVNCIINSFALLEHEAIIEDNCHISTGVILNGRVQIGEGSFIGSGTVVKENVKIQHNTVISMGSIIKESQ